jgi:hypothetical protein
MLTNSELGDFLHRYCEVQTYENALGRYSYSNNFLNSLFDKLCVKEENKEYVNLENLKSILKPIFKEVSE